MAVDPATGIYLFEASDPDTPMHTTLNLGMTSVRDAMLARKNEIAVLQNQRQSYRRFNMTRSGMGDSPNRFFLAVSSEDTGAASPNPFPYTYTSSGTDNGAFTLPAGVYGFDLWGSWTANTTGRSALSMWTGLSSGDAASGGTMLRESSWGGSGSFTAFITVGRMRLSAPTKLWFRSEKITGGSHSCTADLGITRYEAL